MNPTEPRSVISPTRCKLCGKDFKSNPLHSATIVNANPQAKLQQIQAIVSPLMNHLQKKHQKELAWTQLVGGEYAGLLALNFFQCEEPALEQQRDYTRWKINTLTRRATVNDERIRERLRLAYLGTLRDLKPGEAFTPTPAEQAAAETFMESRLAQEIIETMMRMRDVLEERGRYVMADPPPTPQSDNHHVPSA